MPSFQIIALSTLALALFTAPTTLANTENYIRLCKTQGRLPVDDAEGHCARLGSFNLGGCYWIPNGWGKQGQSYESWMKGESTSIVCGTFRDEDCKKQVMLPAVRSLNMGPGDSKTFMCQAPKSSD